jgi:hypothetical protein
MTQQEIFPSAPRDEPAGDIGDQAQRLQMAEEQEAIAAALAGSPRGSDEDSGRRHPDLDLLEGEDPASDPSESDSSDDPTYGGGLVAYRDLSEAARDMADRSDTPFIIDETLDDLSEEPEDQDE